MIFFTKITTLVCVISVNYPQNLFNFAVNKFHDFQSFRRTDDKVLPVFHSNEEALFGMRDEHPHFPVIVVLKMAEETVQSAAAECSDGFVEETVAVFNDAARFDVFQSDLNFAYGPPYPKAFFVED